MRLKTLRRDWEDLAEMDPYWAILSYNATRFGHWDMDRFFRTGEAEIAETMQHAQLFGYPVEHAAALDFGCGVGRLTRALAGYFDECYGIDISTSMIGRAQHLNQAYPNCHFAANVQENLRLFPDNMFDIIYSVRVLQHVPQREAIASYIEEFVRVLKVNGLLVFQLPCYIAPRYMRQRRMRLYALLRNVGISQRVLYQKLRLYPIRMNFLPQEQVLSLLAACRANVLDVRPDTFAPPHESRTYYVTK